MTKIVDSAWSRCPQPCCCQSLQNMQDLSRLPKPTTKQPRCVRCLPNQSADDSTASIGITSQNHEDSSTTVMGKPLVQRRILFVDAYDSFSENIISNLRQALNATVTLMRIDDGPFGNDDLEKPLNGFDAVVVGPGPGDPNIPSDLGVIPSVWSAAERCKMPVLGICLGFQSLCLKYGAPIYRMPLPCHGHAKRIYHKQGDIFLDVGPVIATCYNSLGLRVDDLLEDFSRPISAGSTSSYDSFLFETSNESAQTMPGLAPLAWDENGWLMAVRHQRLPFWGFQFHPESCKSSLSCQDLLQRWWREASSWNSRYRRLGNTSRQREEDPGRPIGDSTEEKTLLTNVIPIQHHHIGDVGLATNAVQSSMADTLADYLIDLTASTGLFVQTASIRFTAHDKIADFCYQHSAGWNAMLESTKKGRFSIYAIPSPSSFRLEASPETVTLFSANATQKSFGIKDMNLYDQIQLLMADRRCVEGRSISPFWGGFIGFFSYEMGLQTSFDFMPHYPSQIPDVSLVWVERSFVVDHVEKRVHVQSIRRDDSDWLGEMIAQLANLESGTHVGDTTHPPIPHAGMRPHRSLSNQLPIRLYDCHTYADFHDRTKLKDVLRHAEADLADEQAYKSNINSCQEALRGGNSYELCLTVEARVITSAGQSWLLYKNLKNCNPVPFAAYIRLGKTTVLSSSPEQFLSWNREGTLDMIPMKGTVKKSSDMTFAQASAILASPKESAENLMIADLIRHDLYSALGSDADVEVAQLCEVVEHETVYQLISHIRANPPAEMQDMSPQQKHKSVIARGYSALRAALPPGSMTGAPKKRSCEILSKLEKRPRGVYSGVLGYLDVGGGGSFSVCIRTAFSHDDDTKDGRQTWRIGAGGAITVLSDPDAEWEEMQTKMESVLRAFRPRDGA